MGQTRTTTTAVAVRGSERADLDAKAMGEVFFKSGFFADATDAAKATVKIIAGRELGLGAMASMTGIIMVKGRPTMNANTMIAIVLRSGKYKHRIPKHTNTECEIEFFRREGEGWELVGKSTFSMEDAKLAGLSGGDNYRKYPRNMLFARAVSNGCKWYCLGGETEVVTRDGIQKIADLAGKDADLLVPVIDPTGRLHEAGTFVKCPVYSFGTQRLWTIKLRRRNDLMEVRATPEHSWYVPRSARSDALTDRVTTSELKSGDKLRSLRTTPMKKGKAKELSAVGVMQGFVFGDGNRGTEGKPATLEIQKGKDEALLPYFAHCNPRLYRMSKGNDVWRVSKLPRSWKKLPDIRESKAFLLGWLAGWFAADGTVCERGYATLTCVNEQHIRFARSVAAVLGVRHGKISSTMCNGFGGNKPVYTLSLNSRDLPLTFFVLGHHHGRVASMTETICEQPWTVLEVQQSDCEEEVYCAVVDGAHAFGLAGGLMTGNCADAFCGVTPYTPDEVYEGARMTEEGDFVIDAEVVPARHQGGGTPAFGEANRHANVAALRALIKKTRTPEDRILAHYGVPKLASLDPEQVAHAVSLLQDKLAAPAPVG